MGSVWRRLSGGIAVACVGFAAVVAAAQSDVESSSPATTSAPIPTATATPVPDWEHGTTVSASTEKNYWGAAENRQDPKDWLMVPRVLLFIPRMVFRAVLYPIERLAYYIGSLKGPGRLVVFPTVAYRVGFRPSLGLRLVRKFGDHDQSDLELSASYGGRNFQDYYGILTHRFSETLRLRTDFLFRQQGDRRFYGIGNDAEEDDLTRFFYEQMHVLAGLRKNFSAVWEAQLTTGWNRYRTSDTVDLDDDDFTFSDRFDEDDAPGFGETHNFISFRAQVNADLRHLHEKRLVGALFESNAVLDLAVDGNQFSNVQYGFRVTGLTPLFRDRIIGARIVVQGATGLGDDQAPFYSLPRGGSGGILRGYPSGRFRDEFLTAANVEYRWAVAEQGDAFIFMDAGRVFPDIGDFSFSNWNFGYGFGLRFLTRGGAVLSLQFGFSSEFSEVILLTGNDLF